MEGSQRREIGIDLDFAVASAIIDPGSRARSLPQLLSDRHWHLPAPACGSHLCGTDHLNEAGIGDIRNARAETIHMAARNSRAPTFLNWSPRKRDGAVAH
jgi:hypothetical protein